MNHARFPGTAKFSVRRSSSIRSGQRLRLHLRSSPPAVASGSAPGAIIAFPARVLALVAALGLCACNNDNSSNNNDASAPTPTPTPTTSVEEVRIDFNQSFRLSPGADGNVGTGVVGRLAHARNPADRAVIFSLSGVNAGRFSVDNAGQISLINALDAALLPLNLIVEARLAQQARPVAVATVEFYALVKATDSRPGASASASAAFVPNQSFSVGTDTPANASFGQLAYSAQGLTGSLVFALSGAGAANFAVDSSARLFVSQSASLSVGATQTLTVSAYSDSTRTQELASTTFTVAVAAAVPAIVIATSQSVSLELPVAAAVDVATVSARLLNAPTGASSALNYSIVGGNTQDLFAIDADDGEIRTTTALALRAGTHILRIEVRDTDAAIDLVSLTELTVQVRNPARLSFSQSGYALSSDQFELSETSAPGLCLMSFGPPPGAPGCGVSVFVIGDPGSGAVSYQVVNLDTDRYLQSASSLVLRAPPDYSQNGQISFTVRATMGGQSVDTTVSYRMRAPQIAFAQTPYVFAGIPLAPGASTTIATVQAETSYSAARNALSYSVVSGNSGNRFVIGAQSGEIRYASAQAASPGERLTLMVRASRAGAQNTIPVQIHFAPGISFVSSSYSARVDSRTNFPDHRLGQVAVRTTPTDAAVSFRTAGDAASRFRVDDAGVVYLSRSLTRDTTVQIEAFSGQVSVSANFTVSVGDPDFIARVLRSEDTGGRLIYFSAVVPATLNVVAWRWNFGDGNTGTGAELAHLYKSAGTFSVSLEMTLADASTRTITHDVSPHEGGDPLASLQWYLGQEEPGAWFSYIGGDGTLSPFLDPRDRPLARPGESIRAPDPQRMCGALDTCRGEGVVVRIIDGGAQMDHPDLMDNFNRALSWDTAPQDGGSDADLYVDPGGFIGQYGTTGPAFMALLSSNLDARHATAVAGIISARDLNGIGGRGIAPRAVLTNYNSVTIGSDEALSLGFQTSATDDNLAADITNNSWGVQTSTSTYTRRSATLREAVAGTLAANDGRGFINIKAAGNNGDAYGLANDSWRGFGNRHSAGLEELNNFHGMIVVSSVLSNGEEGVASNAGDSVALAAYGGPRQCDDWVMHRIDSGFSNPIGIVTTDLMGDRGNTWRTPVPLIEALAPQSSSGSGYRLFDYPDNIEDYELCFNGTSAAAAQVSGAAALMLQARPDLSWRDARAVLIETARRNAPSHPDWERNGAGRYFNPSFGFGVLDVSRALALARRWNLLGEQISYQSADLSANSRVADCAGSGCASSSPNSVGVATAFNHTVSSTISTIETVEVQLRLEFSWPGQNRSAAPLRGTVEIALEHRDGTGRVLSRSLLHKRHPFYGNFSASSDSEAGFPALAAIDWNYLSVRHYGEAPGGSWHLIITDHEADGASIVLKNWKLVVRGH